MAFGAAEEFLDGSGRLESGLEPIILLNVGVVLKGRKVHGVRRGERRMVRRVKDAMIVGVLWLRIC